MGCCSSTGVSDSAHNGRRRSATTGTGVNGGGGGGGGVDAIKDSASLSSDAYYSDAEDEGKRRRMRQIIEMIDFPAKRKGAPAKKPPMRAEFYQLGSSETPAMDDWFIAYCKATTARAEAFQRDIIDAATPEVRRLVIEGSRKKKVKPAAATEATTPRESGRAEAFSPRENEDANATNNHTAANSEVAPREGEKTTEEAEDDEYEEGEPSAEQQLYMWKRYGFANLAKDGLATLDTTFFTMTKQSDTMGPNGLTNFRRKLPKLLYEREEHFLFFMSVLALRGRETEFQQMSPARVRRNFSIPEWSLEVAT